MSHRRNGLGKQVTEAKEGPLELREKGRGNAPGGRRRGPGKAGHAPEGERALSFNLFQAPYTAEPQFGFFREARLHSDQSGDIS